jgi:hypothetical protein
LRIHTQHTSPPPTSLQLQILCLLLLLLLYMMHIIYMPTVRLCRPSSWHPLHCTGRLLHSTVLLLLRLRWLRLSLLLLCWLLL